jgi:hypothetical protein
MLTLSMGLAILFEHVFVDTKGPMGATAIKAKIPPVNHSKNSELVYILRLQMVVSWL